MKTISIKMPESLLEEIDRIARQKNSSRSSVIRDLLKEGLSLRKHALIFLDEETFLEIVRVKVSRDSNFHAKLLKLLGEVVKTGVERDKFLKEEVQI